MQHGRPCAVKAASVAPELMVREGMIRPRRESERPIVPLKPGKPVEERGLGLIET